MRAVFILSALMISIVMNSTAAANEKTPNLDCSFTFKGESDWFEARKLNKSEPFSGFTSDQEIKVKVNELAYFGSNRFEVKVTIISVGSEGRELYEETRGRISSPDDHFMMEREFGRRQKMSLDCRLSTSKSN